MADKHSDSDNEEQVGLLTTQENKEDDIPTDKAGEKKPDPETYSPWDINENDLKRLFLLAKTETGLIIIATIALVLSSAGNLVVPQFVGVFVDSVIDDAVIELTGYVLVLVGIFLVVAVFSLIRAAVYEIAGQRIVTRLRIDLFEAILSQDIGFFDKERTGELVNRLAADCQVLQEAVTVDVSILLRSLVQLIGAIVMCFITSYKLSLVVVSIIPLILLFGWIYGKYIKKLSRAVQDALAETTAFAEESISSMQTVRAFCGETHAIKFYGEKVWKVFETKKKLAFVGGLFAAVAGFIASLSLAGSLWFGGELCKSKEMTPGQLTTFLFYTITVVSAVGLLASVYSDFMKAVGASRRIFFLLDREPQVRFSGGKTLEKFEGRVKFEDVHFSYPSRPDEKVMDGFNLELEPGKVVALVGHSGGGKTTVAKLLIQFYYPTSGKITVDGVDIKELDPFYWRSKIGMVNQEPTLFATTIKGNILYAYEENFLDEEEKKQKVKQVSKMANAHEFIRDLQEKYDTMVGERGVRLSGGQKQRVAIARALVRDPRILIFDEATSALDSESEYKVQSAIDHLLNEREGKSVLVIAHRLSTVKSADEVVVIEHGKIVERGKHDELMERNGIYKDLVKRQLEIHNN